MGLYRIGAIALPISKLFGPDALMYRLNNSSAKAILLEPESVEKIEPIRKDVPELRTSSSPAARRAASAFDDLIAKGSRPFHDGDSRTPRIRSC